MYAIHLVYICFYQTLPILYTGKQHAVKVLVEELSSNIDGEVDHQLVIGVPGRSFITKIPLFQITILTLFGPHRMIVY